MICPITRAVRRLARVKSVRRTDKVGYILHTYRLDEVDAPSPFVLSLVLKHELQLEGVTVEDIRVNYTSQTARPQSTHYTLEVKEVR